MPVRHAMSDPHNKASSAGQTHFGYQTVDERDKARRVADVFDSVASKYDVMNDFMSLGMHRAWKRFTLAASGVRQGDRVLDIAGGSGDLAFGMAELAGAQGEVWLTDINHAMLAVGRNRLIDRGLLLPVAQCDAEQLPFPDNYFHCVSVAFGLRNMTHKDLALREMNRVLKPGGKLLVLEFSKVAPPLAKAYDWYSFKVLPKLGQLVAGDSSSYQYLAESIRMHPDQETLKTMMQEAGFGHVDIHNLSAGVVALHMGIKC